MTGSAACPRRVISVSLLCEECRSYVRSKLMTGSAACPRRVISASLLCEE